MKICTVFESRPHRLGCRPATLSEPGAKPEPLWGEEAARDGGVEGHSGGVQSVARRTVDRSESTPLLPISHFLLGFCLRGGVVTVTVTVR